MPAEHISFGVGSFHFRWTPSTPFELTEEAYAAPVKEALESLPNTTNITFRHSELGETDTITEDRIPTHPLSKGGAAFPSFTYFELAFDLYIPQRIQRELITDYTTRTIQTERFRIFVHHTYFQPATFVQLLTPEPVGAPTTGVEIVRRYLSHKLPRTNNIEFHYATPTPLYANFHLTPYDANTPQNAPFVSEIRHPRGYDRVAIGYNRHSFTNSKAAFRKLRSLLDVEIGFFYQIKSLNQLATTEWTDITDSLFQLTDDIQGQNQIKRTIRLIGGAAELQDIRVQLVQFQTKKIQRTGWLETHMRLVYQDDNPTFLREYVDDSIQDRPHFPDEPVSSLIQFLESQQSKSLEYLVLILTAIISGATGAGLTLLVQLLVTG